MKALLYILAFLVTFACGWYGNQLWSGQLLDVVTVAESTQSTGEQFVTADRAVTAATETLADTREKTRTIIERVPVYVPADCPPGAGPVSDSAVVSLRDALEQATFVTTGSARVRAGGK